MIRGVAALSVVVAHCLEKGYPWFRDFQGNSFDLGRFGVIAFFAVSGFVIPVSLQRAGKLSVFWITRFFRLYPLYWFSLICLALMLPLRPSLGAGFDPHNPKHWLFNVTMFQGLFGYPNATTLYWTLGVEMIIYFLCTGLFLIGALKHTKLILWLSVGAFAALLAAKFLHITYRGETVYYSFFFAAAVGMALYQIKKNAMTWPQLLLPCSLYLCLIPLDIHFKYGHNPINEFHGKFIQEWVSMVSALTFVMAVARWGDRGTYKVVAYLGVISYSIYLLQGIAITLLAGVMNPILYLLLVVGTTIAVSAVVYRFLEFPMITLGHSITAALKGRVSQPSKGVSSE
jgi:peptidoglycan/LPS O-acetylase OafA/YrhL